MPARIEWYDEDQTYILMEFTAPLTWEEFHRGTREAHSAIQSVRHPVTPLIHALAPLPPGGTLTHFRTAFNTQPPNVKLVIVVYEDARPLLMFMQSLLTIIRAIFPNKSHLVMVRGMDTALAMLKLPAREPAADRP